MDPSLLIAQPSDNVGACVNQPNPLQLPSSIPRGESLVGHELDSLTVSESLSNQTNYSLDAQEVGSQTTKEFSNYSLAAQKEGSKTTVDYSAAQQQHLPVYSHEREEQNRLAGKVSQEGKSTHFDQSVPLTNSNPLEVDPANDLESGGFGGSGGGSGNLTGGVSFLDDNPSQILPHFGREAPVQEPNHYFGEGSSSQPINDNISVQNPQADRSVGHNLDVDQEEASQLLDRHLLIEPAQGGGQVAQPLGPNVTPSGDPSLASWSIPPNPRRDGVAPPGNGNASGPSFPARPGGPVHHTLLPVPEPVNLDPSLADGDGPPLEEKPSLSLLFGKVLKYGGTAFKANFGYCLECDLWSSRKFKIKALFNIGTDIGASPHEPNLLQGHGSFNNVKLKIDKHHVDYEIGRIAGIKYNKLSYGLPLKKVSSLLPEDTRLHAGYYTENSWFPLPLKIKTNFYLGFFLM